LSICFSRTLDGSVKMVSTTVANCVSIHIKINHNDREMLQEALPINKKTGVPFIRNPGLVLQLLRYRLQNLPHHGKHMVLCQTAHIAVGVVNTDCLVCEQVVL